MTTASRAPAVTDHADRLAAHLRGLELWHAARRHDEGVLAGPGLSRERRLDATHQLRVRQRQHEVIVERTALALAATGDCSFYAYGRPRAVVAHRHEWTREKFGSELARAGFDVLGVVDNGADTVGLCVAEQPDLCVVDELLGMAAGPAVAAEVRQLSPRTLVAGYVQQEQAVGALLDAGASAVYCRRVPPAEVVAELAVSVAAALRQTTLPS